MPAALILYGIRGGVCNLLKNNSHMAALVWRTKQILNRAVHVFRIYLRMFGVGTDFVYRMDMVVQLQQKCIRHHHSYKEQEQKQRDIFLNRVHLSRLFF